MDLQKSLKQAWDILLFKEPVMQSVANDKEALTPALVILAIASVISSLGSFIFPSVVGLVTYRSGLMDVVLQSAISIGVGIAVLYITGYFAEQIFHAKVTMEGYVRVMGHATLVNVIGLIPAFSGVGGIWGLVVMCIFLNKIGKMEAGPIVLLILLEVLVFGAIGMILLFAGLGTGLGLAGMSW